MSAENPTEPLVFVASYNKFENLAHTPDGTVSAHSLYVYRLDTQTGQLVLLTVLDGFENPAFLRYHPQLNVLYFCTESIADDGDIVACKVNARTGALSVLGKWSAHGKSTCYLTIDTDLKHMLAVNYWDSTLSVLPMETSGALSPVSFKLVPDRKVVASSRSDHLTNRQLEPHNHAIVLDPYNGTVAYVPDLGTDVIKQFVFDKGTGSLIHAGQFQSGSDELKPHGPRYLQFHPKLPVAYVVNELSSTVAVFSFNIEQAARIAEEPEKPTLTLLQTISTIPSAFPRHLNTCGRITVTNAGTFVVVSNRGHNSISTYRVNDDGTLCSADYFHTRGRTPRHFQFDSTGNWLLVANQDTDSVSVFSFDRKHGTLNFAGHTYDVPSPNFVCVQMPYHEAQ
ncbi:hypothetical protein PTSG_03990 [Salpingoeca rosetta]|uniref:6-phosphogluconolactonase n=1 Tax=Salpingoeca rosetta (strain ATCC 50818 / BSB-021) TaxID=946362 RepID=F2U7G7_SALR5|nr:uncharacterized protein PTSG_03990 [Salpingoeca rosetta]EGD83384.1 hypothetical protein PTSG_03990 [Salpingoeca rosetta]|eukprot:XP_004994888.1 hypothetical protein PTSG_03990 [Salpingoeca rosetta]